MLEDSTVEKPTNSYLNKLMKIYDKITDPHPSVSNEMLHQRIKFANTINLSLISVLVLLFISRAALILLDPNTSLTLAVFFPLLIIFLPLGIVLVSKSRYSHVSIYLTIGVFLIGNWADYPVYSEQANADQVLINMTLVLGVGLVMAGLILPERQYALVTILAILDLIAFYYIALDYPIEWVVPKIIFLMIVAGITSLGLYHRNTTLLKLINQTQELQIEKKRAEEADRAKSQFLANVSHEVRTPLNVIMGYSQILREGALSEKQQNYIEAITKANTSLKALIDDILDVNLIERGKLSFKSEEINLESFMNDVENSHQPYIAKKQLKFDLELDEKLPARIIADPKRLRQIINNLLENAIKYTNAGTISLRISSGSISADECNVEIQVADTGIGIPEDLQSKLFEPFIQTPLEQKEDGVGLGLAIVKQIVDLWDGEISFESKVNVGTTFFIKIPCGIPEALQTDYESPIDLSLKSDSEQEEKTPERILLVDDLEDNLNLLQIYLEDEKFEISTATNGEEAVRSFQTEKFALVIMDIRMPVMDGNTAVKLMRKLERDENLKETPIIAVTAYAMENEREKSLAIGFTEYLAKPIEKETLLDIIALYTAA
ncbi:MAG: ATP-binding protein [Candidatus Heimdallarchaeota archaeon]